MERSGKRRLFYSSFSALGVSAGGLVGSSVVFSTFLSGVEVSEVLVSSFFSAVFFVAGCWGGGAVFPMLRVLLEKRRRKPWLRSQWRSWYHAFLSSSLMFSGKSSFQSWSSCLPLFLLTQSMICWGRSAMASPSGMACGREGPTLRSFLNLKTARWRPENWRQRMEASPPGWRRSFWVVSRRRLKRPGERLPFGIPPEAKARPETLKLSLKWCSR